MKCCQRIWYDKSFALQLNFCFLLYVLILLVRKPQQHYGNVILAKLKYVSYI